MPGTITSVKPAAKAISDLDIVKKSRTLYHITNSFKTHDACSGADASIKNGIE